MFVHSVTVTRTRIVVVINLIVIQSPSGLLLSSYIFLSLLPFQDLNRTWNPFSELKKRGVKEVGVYFTLGDIPGTIIRQIKI